MCISVLTLTCKFLKFLEYEVCTPGNYYIHCESIFQYTQIQKGNWILKCTLHFIKNYLCGDTDNDSNGGP